MEGLVEEYICVCVCKTGVYIYICLLEPDLRYMEVPRLGIQSEL